MANRGPPSQRAYTTYGTNRVNGNQIFDTRDPDVKDVDYEIDTRWTNTSSNKEFYLKSFVNTNKITEANWIAFLDASSSIIQVTPSSGTTVTPTSGNINVNGTGIVTVTGSGDTLTINAIAGATGITTLTADSGGSVGPTLGNINTISSVASTANSVDLQLIGNPGTSTITLTQYNRLTGTASGAGVTTLTPISFALGATPAVYRFEVRVAAFDSAAVLGAGYSIWGAVRTTGAAGVVIGTPDKIIDEEGALVAGNANLIVTGNNMEITYDVPAGSTVNVRADVFITQVV